jgi:glucose-6-phosphate 1-epimerase
MTTLSERLKRFEIPGRITILEGNGELTKIDVVTDWSIAEVYLHGAHVTGFQKQGEAPLLFTSQFSRYKQGQPIRGGVPVIFPWFGAREGEPAHGFARLHEWELHETTALPQGGVSLRFSLPEIAETGVWPSFSAYYIVTVTDQLHLQLIVTNLSPDQPFAFENCLHTYFAVGDIRQVAVVGLEGTQYLDKVLDFAPQTESAEAIRIAGEVDRVYLDTTGPVQILDPRLRRKIIIEKNGSDSTVVWNPWIAKAQQMPDFGNDEYQQMICVESGNVARNKLTLLPGHSAVLGVQISSTPI